MSDWALYENRKPTETLAGKTLIAIDINTDKDRIEFHASDGSEFLMYHSQDCCEGVSIEDIIGDVNDLIGSPILSADEESNSDNPKEYSESHTWTFYKLATIKGNVTLRWYGSSNGYYSESVSFAQTKEAS